MIKKTPFDLFIHTFPFSLQDPDAFSLSITKAPLPLIIAPVSFSSLIWGRFFSAKNYLPAVDCLYTADSLIRKIAFWKLRKKFPHLLLPVFPVQHLEIAYLFRLLLSMGKASVTLLGFEERLAKKFQNLLRRIQCDVSIRGCIDPSFCKYNFHDVIKFLKKVQPHIIIVSHKVPQKRTFFDSIHQGQITNAIFFVTHPSIYNHVDPDKISFFQLLLSFTYKILSFPFKILFLPFSFLYCVIIIRCPSRTDDGASYA